MMLKNIVLLSYPSCACHTTNQRSSHPVLVSTVLACSDAPKSCNVAERLKPANKLEWLGNVGHLNIQDINFRSNC